jgi:hypothetical protein
VPTPPISGGSVVRNAVLDVHGYAPANTGGSGRRANANEIHAISLARLLAGCQHPRYPAQPPKQFTLLRQGQMPPVPKNW